MRKSGIFCIALLAAAVITAGIADAQLITDPSLLSGAGYWEAGGGLLVSTVEYDVEGVDKAEVSRTILGGYAAQGRNDRLDLYGGIGVMIASTAKNDGGSSDGNGFMLSGGSRGKVAEIGAMDMLAYGQLQYFMEGWDDLDGTLFEIAFGAVLTGAVGQNSVLYGGIDLIPFSSGTVDNSGKKGDYERANIFGVRGGWHMILENGLLVRAEVAFVDETSFLLGAGVPL